MVMPSTRPAPGQLVESNIIIAEAYLRQFGTDVIRYSLVMDNHVLISTGSSAETKVFHCINHFRDRKPSLPRNLNETR